jgi:hypothetical protein
VRAGDPDARPQPGDAVVGDAVGHAGQRTDAPPNPARRHPAGWQPSREEVGMIEPDAKDWTWVLDRPCPECGFVAAAHDPVTTGAVVRVQAAAWRTVLARPDVATRRRPDRWSPLEYGCHVRDVYVLYRERLRLMLDTDDPRYPNWDQDETAVARDYGRQDPARVAAELDRAAEALAADFDAVTGAAWERPGRRSDGARFTVASFARYLVHDPHHHLADVSGGP